MATARLSTCCRSLEYLLVPLKVTGASSELSADVDPIINPQCKMWAKPGEAGPHPNYPPLLFQEGEDCLRRGIGLGQGGNRRLLEDLRLGQVGGFGGHIGIAYARLSGREAGDLRVGQTDRVIQFVLAGADDALDGTERCDGVIDGCDRAGRRLRAATGDSRRSGRSERVANES